MEENIIHISKDLMFMAIRNAITKPVDRHVVLLFLDKILSLTTLERKKFMVYNFHKYPRNYSIRLMSCLPELWENIKYTDLMELMYLSSHSFKSLKRFIEFTHKFLGINTLILLYENSNISNSLKESIKDYFLKNTSLLFKDEIDESEMFYNEEKMGIKLDVFDNIKTKLLAYDIIDESFGNKEDVQKYLAKISNLESQDLILTNKQYLSKRWQTEKGKELINFFLSHINEGRNGYEKIEKKWEENEDFFLHQDVSIKYKGNLDIFLDLRYLNLEGKNLSNGVLSGKSLNLIGINLENACLDHAQFHSAVFEDANLQGAYGTDVSLMGVIIIDSNLGELSIKTDKLLDSSLTVDIMGSNLTNSKFDNVEFINCCWVDVDASNCIFEDSLLSLSLTRYSEDDYNYLKKIDFKNSRFTNTKINFKRNWEELEFSYTNFRNVEFRYLSHHQIPMAKKLNFIGASFKNSSFDEVDFSNSNFNKAIFDKVHFTNSKLVHANFENAEIRELTLENVEMDEKLYQQLVQNPNCKIIPDTPPARPS